MFAYLVLKLFWRLLILIINNGTMAPTCIHIFNEALKRMCSPQNVTSEGGNCQDVWNIHNYFEVAIERKNMAQQVEGTCNNFLISQIYSAQPEDLLFPSGFCEVTPARLVKATSPDFLRWHPLSGVKELVASFHCLFKKTINDMHKTY